MKRRYINVVSLPFTFLGEDVKLELAAEMILCVCVCLSYGGMLSAYMRFRYPNIVSGSIAASAPIVALAGDSSRDYFFQHVTQVFSTAP